MGCVTALAYALTMGFGAVTLQSAVGGRSELSAGVGPPAPGLPGEASVALQLEPFAASRLRLSRHFLTLRYSPRLLLRQPNLADRLAPLLLHRGDAGMRLLLSRRTSADAAVQAYYGELEYGRVHLVLGETSVTRPNRAVIPVTGYAPSVGITHAVTRRYSLLVSLSGSRSGPVRGSEAGGLATVDQIAGSVTQQLQISRIDQAALATSVGSIDFDPGRALELAGLAASWQRALTTASSASLGAGLTAARRRRSSEDPELFPSGNAGISGPLRVVPGRRATGLASVGVQASPDAIGGDFSPVLAMAAEVRVNFEPWTVYLQMSATGAAALEPRDEDLRETRAGASAGALLPLGAGAEFDVGVRATAWTSRGLELSDAELWAFAAVSFILPAGPGDPGWAR